MLSSSSNKINLLGLDRKTMEDFFLHLGEKPYRAQQVIKWIHAQGAKDFQVMTNISKTLREKLAEVAEISLPEVVYANTAQDGTYKWLLRLQDGNCIETVFI